MLQISSMMSSALQNIRKSSFSYGFNQTLTRNNDYSILDKAPGIAHDGVEIDHIHWYVPYYTAPIQQKGVLLKQILSKTPMELLYFERFVFMKEGIKQN